MALDFEATIDRTYELEGQRVLVIGRDYKGDVEVGDWVEITLASGTAPARVASVAWGSAFHAEDPPLTLVVADFEGVPEDGASVRGIDAPA